jgi:hypothetical protein|tara:strand:+ start:274 stop:675 length:402 start_codon:yes stop_codon:yes gene_type:complete
MAGKGQGEHSAENGKKGGRPKSTATLRAQMMREALSKEVEKDKEAYFEAWKDLALGHFLQVTDKDGNVTKVYKKAPDGKALKDILDQTMGKAPQQLDVTTDGESLNKIEVNDPEALAIAKKYDAELRKLHEKG